MTDISAINAMLKISGEGDEPALIRMVSAVPEAEVMETVGSLDNSEAVKSYISGNGDAISLPYSAVLKDLSPETAYFIGVAAYDSEMNVYGYSTTTFTTLDLSSITVNMKGTLDVLPVGALPPNPAELLISDRFGKLITELRSEYDYIFLDCPPIDVVADTSIIASAADMTIFIVRAGLMDKRALPMVEEISKSGVYPRMAIALNGIEPKERKYGYGRYGYGHES